MSPFADLDDRLSALMVRDERRLRRRLHDARKAGDRTALAQFEGEVAEAEARVERRRALAPETRYPAELPITDRKDDILAAIRDHQVVVVAGETGSGKSTQLPKMCVELGRGIRGLIGHTQPRRIAARSVAERVAEELGTPLGGAVGYTVRFTDRVGDDTLVKVMTDGILLAEIQRDRSLARYDTLIIDEAHERSLNIDFILGYLKQLLPRRPDLKVVITSATIDTERFSRHFADAHGQGAPIVEVSGRTYPVEIRYEPVVDDEEDTGRDQVQAICDAVVDLEAEGPGDVLVFLSGEREIRDTADALVRMELRNTEILPLYARLSATEQHRVFSSHRGRRVVLATNVAETSLTVPGIRYVVDPGTARISRYNRRTKVQRLPIEAISQASANQRAGRCGRVGPGVCIRLYSEEDFLSRPEFTEPEILRTNLASVILQMAAAALGDVAEFPFVDPPDARNIRDGIALLEELGALDERQRLTTIGRRLAQLPLDPRLGRMVLEADRNGCVREVMVIAAALSIQDPRERPTGKEAQALQQHARFKDPESDFLAYLKLWDHLREQQRALSSSQFRRLCKAEYLNYLRVREWQDIYSQLRRTASGLGIHLDPKTDELEQGDRNRIHISLLAGLLSHIGMRDGMKQEYIGARNARFVVAPGSAMFKKGPRWLMAGELVETNRMWGRVVARIQPEWVERLGEHLAKRTYSDPEWDGDRGTAMVTERVTVYGLPVVAGRRVNLGGVDPDLARDLFIQHALVEGDWHGHHHFVTHNARLIEEVRALEDRVRRRDILVGDDALFDFYDERLGREVTSSHHFDGWWKKARTETPHLLDLTRDRLLATDVGTIDDDRFPDVWRQGDLELPLTYVYEPGAVDDGVTVHVPLALLNRVSGAGFDWHIPGLRLELVTELIRSLPKAVRRSFVPAPDFARAFLGDGAGPWDGPLLDALPAHLTRRTGDPIPPGSWQPDRLPDHLTVTFSIDDEDGKPLAVGKDLDELRLRLRAPMRAAIAEAAPAIEQAGLREWSFGALERTVESPWAGHTVTGYPAIVDEGDAVAIRVLGSAAEQRRATWAGVRRLLRLTIPSPKKTVQRLLRNDAKLALAQAPGQTQAELLDDCVTAAFDRLMAANGGVVWDAIAFDQLRAAVDAGLVDAVLAVVERVSQILAAARAVEDRMNRMTAAAVQPALLDVAGQLAGLLRPGFVSDAGLDRLRDVLRYLKAIEVRLDKVAGDPRRDAELMARVQALETEYHDLLAGLPPHAVDAAAAEEIRWLLEELRVSLFAQALGTAQRVSEKRIARELDRLAPGP